MANLCIGLTKYFMTLVSSKGRSLVPLHPGPHASQVAGGGNKLPPRGESIFKISNMKTALKLKITMIREYLRLYINPIKPSAGLPNLLRLSL
jgi:hypothetical protein